MIRTEQSAEINQFSATEEEEPLAPVNLSLFNWLESDDPSPIEETEEAPSELLVSLHNDAEEVVATYSTKITAESFARGAALAGGVLSSLGSLFGTCGVICGHTLSSLASAGSSGVSTSLASGISGFGAPEFNLNKDGSFHLSGNVKDVAHKTGISEADLLSGNYNTQDLLSHFITALGDSLSMLFGFGLVESFVSQFFDGFLPNPTFSTAAET